MGVFGHGSGYDLLLRAGYDYVPYASLESIVEENKDFFYYKALRRTQTTLNNEQADWEPWLGFFLRSLKKQKSKLATQVEQVARGGDTELPTLSVRVLELFNVHDRLTIAQMVELTSANKNTLKVRLRELVEAGRIKRFGKARGTWYSL